MLPVSLSRFAFKLADFPSLAQLDGCRFAGVALLVRTHVWIYAQFSSASFPTRGLTFFFVFSSLVHIAWHKKGDNSIALELLSTSDLSVCVMKRVVILVAVQ